MPNTINYRQTGSISKTAVTLSAFNGTTPILSTGRLPILKTQADITIPVDVNSTFWDTTKFDMYLLCVYNVSNSNLALFTPVDGNYYSDGSVDVNGNYVVNLKCSAAQSVGNIVIPTTGGFANGATVYYKIIAYVMPKVIDSNANAKINYLTQGPILTGSQLSMPVTPGSMSIANNLSTADTLKVKFSESANADGYIVEVTMGAASSYVFTNGVMEYADGSPKSILFVAPKESFTTIADGIYTKKYETTFFNYLFGTLNIAGLIQYSVRITPYNIASTDYGTVVFGTPVSVSILTPPPADTVIAYNGVDAELTTTQIPVYVSNIDSPNNLLLVYSASSFTWTPTNGVTYSDGQEVTTGVFVRKVLFADMTEETYPYYLAKKLVPSLSVATKYQFKVALWTGDPASEVYDTSNMATVYYFATLENEPDRAPLSITIIDQAEDGKSFTVKVKEDLSGSYDPDGYIVIVNPLVDPSEAFNDGVIPSWPCQLGIGLSTIQYIGAGTVLIDGADTYRLLPVGTASSNGTPSPLIPGTTYYVRAYPYKGGVI